MAGSDRRPGESERDWTRRLSEMAARGKRERRDEQRQASLDRTAEEASIREAMGDEVFLYEATKELFGLTPDQLLDRMGRASKKGSWDKFDQEVLDQLNKEQKPRFLEGKRARNKRVGKFLKKNKGKINRAQKKGKGWFS